MWQQAAVLLTIALALGLFIWGRWRYDLVGLIALLVVASLGILDTSEVFAGFGNEAVVSVAAIFIVGQALKQVGVAETFANWLGRFNGTPVGQTLVLTGAVAVLSSFMNNTGAVAVFLPVALHVARDGHRLPSSILMPVAFGSLLGGLMTLIGTPPNILISQYRAQHIGEPFGMFDYTHVGVGVTVTGLLFLGLVGWRLLPARRGSVGVHDDLLRIGRYLAEVQVPAQSSLVGQPLRAIDDMEVDATIIGVARAGRRIAVPTAFDTVQSGDALLVEAEPKELRRLIRKAGLELGAEREIAESELGTREVTVQEVVIARGSPLEGRTARGLQLRARYGVNVLAVSRSGTRLVRRLRRVRFRAGDVLLIQARTEGYGEMLQELACLPLVERDMPMEAPKLVLCLMIFVAAVTLVATGALPLGIAFVAASVAMVLGGVLTLKQAYAAIDWPIVVLLAATIPLGTALEKTGGAETIAAGLLGLSPSLPAEALVGITLLATMFISNVMNNAATAVLMAPIAYRLAFDLNVSPDTFLMATAVGASCAFATPIGHQSNVLVLGPGGYRFSDYLRLGLPMSIVVLAAALPLLLLVWPLR